MVAKAGGKDKQLSFERSAEPASGNVPEKASLFEAQVQWLKVTKAFAGSLPTITLNGTPYISFSFA